LRTPKSRGLRTWPFPRSRDPVGKTDTSTLSWPTARTFTELGELTARWLTGEVPTHPCDEGPPEEETAPLIGLLARVNRAGLLTAFSQPAVSDIVGWTQRAAVTGYCRAETLDRLFAAFTPTELVLLNEHQESDSGIRVPVTLFGGRPSTFVGGVPRPINWSLQVTPGAVRDLRRCWYITLVDPVWGRDDRLWPALAAALDLRP
jgi:hypothetical protein